MGNDKIQRNLPPHYDRDANLVKVQVADTENPKNIKVFYVPKGTEFKGNTVQQAFNADTEIQMTKYQIAAMEAAAEGDEYGGTEFSIIDRYDTKQGGFYGQNVTDKLKESGSTFKVSRNPNYDGKSYNADAAEQGEFFATFEDKDGNRGHFELRLPDNK